MSKEDVSNSKKSCMPIYSADDEIVFGWHSSDLMNPAEDDFKRNGQYCKSGLAY